MVLIEFFFVILLRIKTLFGKCKFEKSDEIGKLANRKPVIMNFSVIH